MKEIIINNMDLFIAIITVIVTWFLGNLAKRLSFINNALIPMQNILIMFLSVCIYWWATGDFSFVVASSSPVATLIYDTFHVLVKEE